jgi:hypothetical protein
VPGACNLFFSLIIANGKKATDPPVGRAGARIYLLTQSLYSFSFYSQIFKSPHLQITFWNFVLGFFSLNNKNLI